MVAHQPIGVCEVGEALAIIATQTMGPGADPEMSLPILKNGPHMVVWQPIGVREVDETSTIVATEAADGVNPETVLGIHMEALGVIAHQAISLGEAVESPPIIQG